MRTIITLVAICCAALMPAMMASAQAKTSIIGYMYAGMYTVDGVHGGIEELAVHSDYALRPLKLRTVASAHVMGLGLAHTRGGLSLYAWVSENSPTSPGTVLQFTVNQSTGSLTPKSPASVGRVALPNTDTGNNLWVYDGYGEHGTGASALYAIGCANPSCTHTGLAHYRIDPRTGKLSLAAQVQSTYITDVSLADNHLDVLNELNSVNHETVVAGVISPATGNVRFGSPFVLTDGAPQGYTTAWHIAASGNRLAVGDMYPWSTSSHKHGLRVYPVVGTKILPGEGSPGFQSIYTLAFTQHSLLAGEWVPIFEQFSPNGLTNKGAIFLESAPSNMDPGSVGAPNIPTSIFRLGIGVYTGFDSGPIVQGTDGPGASGFSINAAHPTVAVLHTRAMAGYLLPVDHPPVLSRIGNRSVRAGNRLRFTVTAKDPDPGDELKYSASNLPRGASFATASHTFDWRPDTHQVGVHRGVRLTAADNNAKTDSELITITVKR